MGCDAVLRAQARQLSDRRSTRVSARVSIVVPVHNGAPFLAQAMDSILAQTYDGWEAIVVDDASTDGSAALARSYAERDPARVTLLALDRNLGVAHARNRGIGAAHGELVALLDHDDWLREDYLERMVGLLDAERAGGRNVGIVGCDALLQMPAGVEPDTWGQRLGWFDAVDLDTLIEQNTIFARALFSRAAFEDVGGFAPECAGADDHDLWLRIVQAGYEVAVTREPLAGYRLHGGGQSRNKVTMTAAKLTVYNRLLDRGALTGRQRRAVRRRMRHLRAARAIALVREARAAGRRTEAARLALAAVPHALLAVAQDPSLWSPGALRRRDPLSPP